LSIDEPFEDLSPQQTIAVRNLVDSLPDRRRPSTFTEILPGNRSLRIKLNDGFGVMLRMGPGPFPVRVRDEESMRTTILKLLEPTRKALVQLHSNAVPADYRKLLFFRWKPPEEIVAIGEIENVRRPVLGAVQRFVRQFFPQVAVVMVHTHEEIEQSPLALWD
jgi:hypothetical protein